LSVEPTISSMPQLAAAGARVSRRLEEAVAEYRVLVTSPGGGLPSPAAKARADYERAKAKRKLEARANGDAKSVAAAEDIADASDEIYQANLDRLTMEGQVDACRQEINALRSRLSWGQSMVAAEREVDKQHALTSPSWRDGRER